MSSGSDGDEIEGDEPGDDTAHPCLWDLHIYWNKYLKSTKQRWPQIEFSTIHPECSIHYQKIRKHNM